MTPNDVLEAVNFRVRPKDKMSKIQAYGGPNQLEQAGFVESEARGKYKLTRTGMNTFRRLVDIKE